MNYRSVLLAPWLLASAPVLLSQSGNQPPPPPPVVQALPAAPAQVPAAADQQVYSPRHDALIEPAAANAIVEKFRQTFPADRAPRIVVFVNRALVDATSGLKLTGRTETFENTDNAKKVAGTNTYQAKDTPAAPTLADQQTVRDIERLFGRVFRNAGVQLADARAAAALLPDQLGSNLAGDQAAKERQALKEVADIAIEILISSRNITVPQVSGDASYVVPDIQATAIRLKDAAIIGQATASDIIGRGSQAGHIARRYDVRDITEATALVLMDDMLARTK